MHITGIHYGTFIHSPFVPRGRCLGTVKLSKYREYMKEMPVRTIKVQQKSDGDDYFFFPSSFVKLFLLLPLIVVSQSRSALLR